MVYSTKKKIKKDMSGREPPTNESTNVNEFLFISIAHTHRFVVLPIERRVYTYLKKIFTRNHSVSDFSFVLSLILPSSPYTFSKKKRKENIYVDELVRR